MTVRILLNKEGYDAFIDYLKGIAIIMVLITHATSSEYIQERLLYPIWIYEAVPLFLLIQVFHAYKKNSPSYPSFQKLWNRIIFPFVLTQLVFVAYGFYANFTRNENLFNYFTNMLIVGGGGPGSYYIWIYLQFAILLPLLYKL